MHVAERFRTADEGGFTLIELLVVVIIIGILAAIAIPVFLNQRNGARDASVKSDINALSKTLESGYQLHDGYPNGAQLTALNPVLSPGNTVHVAYRDKDDAETTITNADAVSYSICGVNAESGKVYILDSAHGGLSETATVVGDPADACVNAVTSNDKTWPGTAEQDLEINNAGGGNSVTEY